MIIDTHSHCYWESIAPRIDEILSNMEAYNISQAIQIGCDIPTSLQAIDLARRFPEKFRATAGLHPADAQKHEKSDIQDIINQLEQLILENRDIVVGVGETGLDFHYLSDNPEQDKERQYLAWNLQIELARKYGLPLVIHTRDARSETLEFMTHHNVENAIMHCFSEDALFAQQLLSSSESIYFSFSGILTYPRSNTIQEAASALPLDRILVETDAPFLAPQALRGQINEPGNVRYVLEKLCELRSEPSDLIEQVVYENSKRVYGLK